MDPVFRVAKDDAEMVAAIKRARKTFADFLLAADADLGRAIPILEDAMVKIYLTHPDKPDIGEHVWARYLGHEAKDKKRYNALLLNTPRRIKNLMRTGDTLDYSIRSLSDWLYVEDGQAHGAFTVQVLRTRMTRLELKKHDAGYPFSFE